MIQLEDIEEISVLEHRRAPARVNSAIPILMLIIGFVIWIAGMHLYLPPNNPVATEAEHSIIGLVLIMVGYGIFGAGLLIRGEWYRTQQTTQYILHIPTATSFEIQQKIRQHYVLKSTGDKEIWVATPK